ncbi:MAG: chorismate mutase [Solirubrobacterales bacterium]|nr:chorismate mutase [Solirubrobacterales bacterium]
MSEQTKVVAVRGAVQADNNSAEAILSATEQLMREVISRNDLEADDMISAIFTTTDDLDAEFPAVAARRMGLDGVPLMCAREIPVAGSMNRVIRLMLHYNGPADRPPVHVYLGEAGALRSDLDAAQ